MFTDYGTLLTGNVINGVVIPKVDGQLAHGVVIAPHCFSAETKCL